MPQAITVIGATASPYTRKMLALLRCRRIPYKIIWGNPADVLAAQGLPRPKVALLPTLLFPQSDGTTKVAIDSTPIIRKLEAMHPARAVIPANSVLAFLNYLLEDFADEWGTKYMFHYRWHRKIDADNASTVIPLAADVSLDATDLAEQKATFADRQIARLGVVGSSATTAATIEASLKRVLQKFDAVLAETPFLLGQRPCSADFAFFGQFSQLIGFDPTSRALAHAAAPRTVAWTGLMEDLSGVEMTADAWTEPAGLSDALKALLSEIGTMYVPALLANAKALRAGQAQWQTTIDGALWQQQSFPYQGKCLMWIREEYSNLDQSAKTTVRHLLSETGCADLLQGL